MFSLRTQRGGLEWTRLRDFEVKTFLAGSTDMESKYTASIIFNNQQLDTQSSDNFNRLTAGIINIIETQYPNAQGEIRDNNLGKVIQRYRRAPFE